MFAPRNGPEFHRVLGPDGTLLVVTPTGRHLRELRGPVGLLAVDPRKEERLRRSLDASSGSTAPSCWSTPCGSRPTTSPAWWAWVRPLITSRPRT
ncbi:hypothetical protein [Streptomyces sp. NPDC046832]|uniref:hypothetical protein n=1 Tax=Streptomyces sp. NPDC046832 TaxID=3155020 RepID=UPI00340AA3AD